jgi:hypothetical protein
MSDLKNPSSEGKDKSSKGPILPFLAFDKQKNSRSLKTRIRKVRNYGDTIFIRLILIVTSAFYIYFLTCMLHDVNFLLLNLNYIFILFDGIYILVWKNVKQFSIFTFRSLSIIIYLFNKKKRDLISTGNHRQIQYSFIYTLILETHSGFPSRSQPIRSR